MTSQFAQRRVSTDRRSLAELNSNTVDDRELGSVRLEILFYRRDEQLGLFETPCEPSAHVLVQFGGGLANVFEHDTA